MTLSERLSAIDRLQRSRGFKMGASVLVIVLLLTGVGFSIVNSTRPVDDRFETQTQTDTDTTTSGDAVTAADVATDERVRQIQSIIDSSRSPVGATFVAAAATAVLLVVIWMGLALTYIAAMLVVGAIGAPMYFLGSDTVRALGFVTMGMTVLLLTFSVLIRALSFALSSAHPVSAIARNVLAEAIRMKVSLVLILGLAFLLAAMPMILNAEQPLRYRVQAFLQWSSGLSFWFIALLVVFFSVATVSYEQREKVIWQTMTKPVHAWHYLLGKWMGVSLLSAALLSVTGVGVYAFTEYLRSQPAVGELSAYVPRSDQELITEDRLILETQVLTARESAYPMLPFNPNDEGFDQAVQDRIAQERQLDPSYQPTQGDLARIRQSLFEELVTSYRSIDPQREQYETFSIPGLGKAFESDKPLTLRYKINAGSNRPDEFYMLTFVFEDGTVIPPRQTGLGFSHTMTIDPRFLNDRGELNFQLYNGAFGFDQASGRIMFTPNPSSLTVPPDGLELSYSVGTYTGNFVRIVGVLWIKLALLSMVSVFASTFASFPVASMMSMTVFLMCEGAGFVQDALPGWDRTSDSAGIEAARNIIYHFADLVSGLLTVYSDLSPTQRLADGVLLGWAQVSQGVLTLGVAAVVFYLIAVVVLRNRQLAIYSGH